MLKQKMAHGLSGVIWHRNILAIAVFHRKIFSQKDRSLMSKRLETTVIYTHDTEFIEGFPDESASDEGYLDSTPGLGRCPGEGKGCPLQYSWAFLVAQLVKNPLVVWETWV